jgi:hypothetical protein
MKKIAVYLLTIVMVISLLSPVFGASQANQTSNDLISVSSYENLKDLLKQRCSNQILMSMDQRAFGGQHTSAILLVALLK